MMSLKSIQQAFFENIYANDSMPLQALINGQPDFTAGMRAHIYFNNTHESLKETLSNTFPVCEALVGNAYFAQLATHHVTQAASVRRNLDLYGETFPQTLADLVASREELKSLGYLPAVAQLEWLLHRAYYAKNRQAFDFNALAVLSVEQQASLCFTLADDIYLMNSSFAVLAIWQAHQNKHMLENKNNSFNGKVEHVSIMPNSPFFMVIQRERFSPKAILVDEEVYQLLSAIQAGKTIVELTALSEDASVLLSELIVKQWIASFYLDD